MCIRLLVVYVKSVTLWPSLFKVPFVLLVPNILQIWSFCHYLESLKWYYFTTGQFRHSQLDFLKQSMPILSQQDFWQNLHNLRFYYICIKVIVFTCILMYYKKYTLSLSKFCSIIMQISSQEYIVSKLIHHCYSTLLYHYWIYSGG